MGCPWGVPRGLQGSTWTTLAVHEIIEKPLVFVVFLSFGGARSDIDSKKELLDVAGRSLLRVPEILGGS